MLVGLAVGGDRRGRLDRQAQLLGGVGEVAAVVELLLDPGAMGVTRDDKGQRVSLMAVS